MAVSADELNKFAEQRAVEQTIVGWNTAEEAVEARVVRRIGELELESRGLSDLDETALDAAMLEGLPNLRWIARSGSGLENIDLEAARARGVTIIAYSPLT